jgi:hypothetical protein
LNQSKEIIEMSKTKKMDVEIDDVILRKAQSIARYTRTLKPSKMAGFLILVIFYSGEVTTARRLSKKLMESDPELYDEVLPLIENLMVEKQTIKLSDLLLEIE